jgi:hypothetical protein
MARIGRPDLLQGDHRHQSPSRDGLSQPMPVAASAVWFRFDAPITVGTVKRKFKGRIPENMRDPWLTGALPIPEPECNHFPKRLRPVIRKT